MRAYELVTCSLNGQRLDHLWAQMLILSIGQLTAGCHRKTMQQKYLPLEDAAFSQTVPFYLPSYIENKEAM